MYGVGETSMRVRVDVTAERPNEDGPAGERETASSHLTFVAIDADERVRPVPELVVETGRERERQGSARRAE